MAPEAEDLTLEEQRHIAAGMRRAKWLEQKLDATPTYPGRHYDVAEHGFLMWVFFMAGVDYCAPEAAGDEPPVRPYADEWRPGAQPCYPERREAPAYNGRGRGSICR